MNDIPLSDASFSEVLARVAYRLIERATLHPYYRDWTNADCFAHLARRLDKAGLSALSFWVSAYLHHYHGCEIPLFTRTAFIMRARLGMDFRSVAYFDYKAPRRRDPRVTNRGVTPRATKGGR